MSTWQPIETAAKDESEIILGCRRGIEGWANCGFWSDGATNYWKKAGWYEEMYRGDLLTARPIDPTHWMPLPEPPHE